MRLIDKQFEASSSPVLELLPITLVPIALRLDGIGELPAIPDTQVVDSRSHGGAYCLLGVAILNEIGEIGLGVCLAEYGSGRALGDASPGLGDPFAALTALLLFVG